MARLRESFTRCPDCLHLLAEHSREDGVGCLHVVTTAGPYYLELCPCLRPGIYEQEKIE